MDADAIVLDTKLLLAALGLYAVLSFGAALFVARFIRQGKGESNGRTESD